MQFRQKSISNSPVFRSPGIEIILENLIEEGIETISVEKNYSFCFPSLFFSGLWRKESGNQAVGHWGSFAQCRERERRTGTNITICTKKIFRKVFYKTAPLYPFIAIVCNFRFVRKSRRRGDVHSAMNRFEPSIPKNPFPLTIVKSPNWRTTKGSWTARRRLFKIVYWVGWGFSLRAG